MINFFIYYVINLVPWSLIFTLVCISQGQILQAIAPRLKDHIHVALKKDLIYFLSDCFKAWSTHPTKVILFSSMWLLLNIATSLTFLNVVLDDLKQDTSNSCRTCDVWDGRVIMFKAIYFACDVVFLATWLLCSSIANKCLLMKDNPRCLHTMVTLYGRHNANFSCIL